MSTYTVESGDLKRLEDWIKKNLNPEQFDYYSELKGQMKAEVPHLPDEHIFWHGQRNKNLKTWAKNRNPQIVIDEKRRHTAAPQTKVLKHKIDRHAPDKGYFSIKEFASRHGLNYNTTRREFQELLREGVFEKTGKGRNVRYRVKYDND